MADSPRQLARQRILDEIRVGDMSFGADLVALLIDQETDGVLADYGALHTACAIMGAALELAEEAGRRHATKACVSAMLDTATDARRMARESKGVGAKLICTSLSRAMRSCAREVAALSGGRESALAEATPIPTPSPN